MKGLLYNVGWKLPLPMRTRYCNLSIIVLKQLIPRRTVNECSRGVNYVERGNLRAGDRHRAIRLEG
jgi:hypothetical protein